jgi:transposase-like protein
VRWYLSYPLSSRQVLELLAERGVDVSHRTILTWVQVFGPLLAAAVRRRHPLGMRWFVDEVFIFRRGQKRYLYRAIDEHGAVVDVLLHERRDTASAEPCLRQAIARPGLVPEAVVTARHRSTRGGGCLGRRYTTPRRAFTRGAAVARGRRGRRASERGGFGGGRPARRVDAAVRRVR